MLFGDGLPSPYNVSSTLYLLNSMLTRQEKEKLVDQLADKFSKAKSVVFVDFKGLKLNQTQQLRRQLREENIDYKVAKKTLIKLALEKAGLKDIPVSSFKGSVAVAFDNKDEVAPARLINKFGKENESLIILGGILEKNYLEAGQTITLAKLPTKQESLANLIGQLQAPVSGLVSVLKGNIRNLVYLLNTVANK